MFNSLYYMIVTIIEQHTATFDESYEILVLKSLFISQAIQLPWQKTDFLIDRLEV